MKLPPLEELEEEEFEFLFPSEISGDRSFPFRRRGKGRRKKHSAGAAGAAIVLTNNTITAAALVGDTVGTFFVQGSSDVFTFTLLSDPGSLYSLLGPLLKVAAALSVGFEAIVVKADNGAGQVLIQPFLIFVTRAGGYIPTYELLGF